MISYTININLVIFAILNSIFAISSVQVPNALALDSDMSNSSDKGHTAEGFDFDRDSPDHFDSGDVAGLFDFVSGLFAALLCGLSLLAYMKLKLKRILFVSIAFGLFAIRTIVAHFDLFMPEVESSIIEMTLAIMTFVALSLFFVAIVRKERVHPKINHFNSKSWI